MKTKIPELRRARRLSQEELAQAVGKYTASLPLAHKLARYFGLAIEDVFDFSDLDGEE